jgi:O-antigen/teichoic acid export membrane protein
MTIPTFAELAFTYVFARRYVRELPNDLNDHNALDAPNDLTDLKDPKVLNDLKDPNAPNDSALAQFRFTMPLALGGFLLAAAPLMVATFVGRTTDHVAMLAIHYVTIGLANAVGYAALRMQAVTIQFPPEYDGDLRVLRYAVAAGLALGVLILISALPGISDWYFHTVQSIPPENIGKTRIAMLIYAVWPVLQTIRGNAEGFAAVRKRPGAVLSGQIAYLATLVAVLAATLHLGMPGWLMGVTAILMATLATTAAVRTHLAIVRA